MFLPLLVGAVVAVTVVSSLYIDVFKMLSVSILCSTAWLSQKDMSVRLQDVLRILFPQNSVRLSPSSRLNILTIWWRIGMEMAVIAGPIYAISFFWFAWTSSPSISFWAPMISGGQSPVVWGAISRLTIFFRRFYGLWNQLDLRKYDVVLWDSE